MKIHRYFFWIEDNFIEIYKNGNLEKYEGEEKLYIDNFETFWEKWKKNSKIIASRDAIDFTFLIDKKVDKDGLLKDLDIYKKENEINFSMSKSYANHEKERLSEVIKANGTFQYEEAPLDGVLLEYNNIKYILAVIFLMALSYFFITTYLDFYYHKGFLFTLPMKKTSFIIGKAMISFAINIILIISQFGLSLVFSYLWKWKNTFNYPVFSDLTGGFLPVNKAMINYIGIEIGICFIALVISAVFYSLYIKIKK